MPALVLAWHPTLDLFSPWARARWQGLDCRTTVVDSLGAEAREKAAEKWHPLHAAQYLYTKGPLANILLSCLGDRTEMAHSVEARTPFLDHRLAEYVNGLPPSLKLAYDPDKAPPARADQGPWWEGMGVAHSTLTEKWLLREAARPFVTSELYERKKHAFTAPVMWPRDGSMYTMLR